MEVHSLTFYAKTRSAHAQWRDGPICFEVWDIAGQERFGLKDVYYIKADCAIIMFDATARSTYNSVSKWHDGLARVCRNIYAVVCGNKVDINREVKITFYRERNLQVG